MTLFHEPLQYWAQQRPASLFGTGARDISYAEADRLSSQWAADLLASGLRPGDRAAFLLSNEPISFLVPLAFSKIGVVGVPLNPRLTKGDFLALIARARARAVVASLPAAKALAGAERELDGVALWSLGDIGPGWRRLADDAPAVRPSLPALVDSDVVLQPYTSGTTGAPKAAQVRHKSFFIESVRWAFSGMRLEPGEQFYLCMPLMLTAGLCAAYHTVWAGATLVAEDFTPQAAWRAMRGGQIRGTMLVPTMVHMILDVADQPEKANLRWIQYGGAPISLPLLRRTIDAFSCDLYQGYGQTESMGTTLLTPADHARALAGEEHLLRSIGRPLIGTELRVVAEDGTLAAPHVVGEINARGDQVFAGYEGDPERTASAFDGEWLRSGDLGYFDEDGYLYLSDRKDDVIITGGINVSPGEIEAVLAEVSGVEDVAVVGVTDDKWGKRVTAVVVTAPGSALTEAELSQACEAKLASFKRPRAFVFAGELPRNANGKVQRHVLRQQLSTVADGAAG